MAASNYLALCNQLILKCGITNVTMTTVANPRGEAARIVSWINEAYRNIQELRPNWLWMEGDVSFATTATKGAYTPVECGISDFGQWKEDSFRNYITTSGVGSEVFMGRLDYDSFRDTYLFNNIRLTYSQPLNIAVAPNKSLLLGLAPDTQGYTVVGKYFRTTSDLVADADLPLLPDRFQMLIVYEAMKSYALFEAASEVMGEADRQYGRMRNKLEQDQLPWITVGDTLA